MVVRIFIAWLSCIACYALAVILSPYRETVSGAFDMGQAVLITVPIVALAALVSLLLSRSPIARRLGRWRLGLRVLLIVLGLLLVTISRGHGFGIGHAGGSTELHFGLGTLAGFVLTILAAFIRNAGTYDEKVH